MPAHVKKARPCEQCGKPTTKGRRPNVPLLCLDCGVAKHERYIRDMAAKSGPAWDAWIKTAGPRGRPKRTDEGS